MIVPNKIYISSRELLIISIMEAKFCRVEMGKLY